MVWSMVGYLAQEQVQQRKRKKQRLICGSLVENEEHCEFIYLRNFLTRTHLQDLIETTAQIHYEAFRAKQLLAIKESTHPTGGNNNSSNSNNHNNSHSSNNNNSSNNNHNGNGSPNNQPSSAATPNPTLPNSPTSPAGASTSMGSPAQSTK